MMKHSTIKKTVHVDSEVYSAYQAIRGQFDNLMRELIVARKTAGLTQSEVAARMGTTQSAVARLEGGGRIPNANTLLKYAKATQAGPGIRLRAA